MADQYTAAPVKGQKTHNGAVPGATNIGALVAVANAAAPTFTEGNQVGLSTDLSGALRVNIASAGGTNVTYQTTPPSLTNGQTAPIQGDTNGNLKVTLVTALPTGANTIGAVTQASGPWTVNNTQINGVTLATGSGVNGTGVQRVTIATDQAAIPASQSGTWNVTVNTALPAGGNTIGAVTQASGPWTSNVTQVGGTAIATGSGVNGAGVQRVTLATDQANINVVVASALPTGANTIGAVTQASGPWTQNLTQVGGNAVSVGNGTAGTGVIRVTIASDNTAFGVNAATYIGGAASAAGAGAANANTQRVILASDQTAVGTPLYVRLTDGTAAFGTSANPFNVVLNDIAGTITDAGQLASGGFGSPTDVAAAGGTSTITGTDVTSSQTAKLAEITFSSSVRCRVELQIASGATGATVTTRRVFFVEANTPLVYSPRDPDFISFTSGGTGNHFQIKATNLDTQTAAPVYGTVVHAI